MSKYLKTSVMRKLERQRNKGEITYGRWLELIEDEVIRNYKKEER